MLAGERAMPRVAASEATPRTRARGSFARKLMRGARKRKTGKTKAQVQALMAAVRRRTSEKNSCEAGRECERVGGWLRVEPLTNGAAQWL